MDDATDDRRNDAANESSTETGSDRLWELDETTFEVLMRALADTAWDEYETDVSPPAPGRGIDVRLADGRTQRLIHVRQDPPDARVGAPAVRDLAALRDERGFAGVTLATTGRFADAARTSAAERGVDLLAGRDLERLCYEHGVERPAVDGAAERGLESELDRVLATYSAYWPASLPERAEALLRAVDHLGEFDRRITAGDASSVCEFVPAGDDEPVAAARFGETHFILYVSDGDGALESVVRLSAYRESQPSVRELRSAFEPPIERALEERNA